MSIERTLLDILALALLWCAFWCAGLAYLIYKDKWWDFRRENKLPFKGFNRP
jgi:hypothetical protein